MVESERVTLEEESHPIQASTEKGIDCSFHDMCMCLCVCGTNTHVCVTMFHYITTHCITFILLNRHLNGIGAAGG